MLSQETATDYAKNRLGLNNIRSRLTSEPLTLLNDIIYNFYHTAYFHNLDLLSRTFPERRVPTVEDNIDALLNGSGGLCWTLNCFMYYLLQGLGYHAYPLIGTVGTTINDHMLVLVCDVVKEGDRYIVDVGFGHPIHKAICLDFDKESEVFTESFLHFKYVKERAENKIWHVHKGRRSKAFCNQESEESWKQAYWFHPEVVEIDFIQDCMKKMVYENEACVFHSTFFRCVTWVKGRCVSIKEKELLIENEDGELKSTKLETLEDLIDACRQYFPNIPTDVVHIAAINIQLFS